MGKVEFNENRYATDCGPSCPKCDAAPDGHSLWLFTIYPAQSSYAQCACCHALFLIQAPGTQDEHGNPLTWPDIHEVKAALAEAFSRESFLAAHPRHVGYPSTKR